MPRLDERERSLKTSCPDQHQQIIGSQLDPLTTTTKLQLDRPSNYKVIQCLVLPSKQL